MTKALDGVRILDFTHVQSGPTCTQLLAWFGADVIKVERPGVGDITRGQLQDIKGVDSLYFTMLNHNKRSIEIDGRHKVGKEVLEGLVKSCDVMVENFAPGALDRMGFTWARIQQLNPRMILASIKGFGPGPYEDCKVYENVAQCAGGAASTTGFDDGPPTRDRRPDRRLRHRRSSRARYRCRAVPAQHHRARPEGRCGDAGRRAEPVPRQAARPAAPRARATDRIPAISRRHLRRSGAACRQRLGRRPAGLDPEMQGLGDRSQRLHLLHRPGAGLGVDLRCHRQAGMENRSGLRQARGPSAASAAHLRHHRVLDHDTRPNSTPWRSSTNTTSPAARSCR